jgi:hypothetical protein
MRIISFIENSEVIRNIPNHLGLGMVREKPPPKARASPIREHAAGNLQLKTHADTSCGDPEYT